MLKFTASMCVCVHVYVNVCAHNGGERGWQNFSVENQIINIFLVDPMICVTTVNSAIVEFLQHIISWSLKQEF